MNNFKRNIFRTVLENIASPTPTTAYFQWELFGITEDTNVSLYYTDSNGVSQSVAGLRGNISDPINVCAQISNISYSHGTLTNIGACPV